MTNREPIYFAAPEEFRDWLDANHAGETELLVGYHKVSTGVASMTWSESVDEALCYGWIDGVRRSVDEQRYTIRFTPRKPGSNWSAVNVAKIEKLTSEGRMRPAGIAAWEARIEAKTSIYSYEQRKSIVLDPEYERQLQSNSDALKFWESQPPSYTTAAVHWVMSAKRQETRERRMAALIEDCAAGRRVGPLTRPGK